MLEVIGAMSGVILLSLITLNAWTVRILIEMRTWMLGSLANPRLIARVRRLERDAFQEPEL